MLFELYEVFYGHVGIGALRAETRSDLISYGIYLTCHLHLDCLFLIICLILYTPHQPRVNGYPLPNVASAVLHEEKKSPRGFGRCT